MATQRAGRRRARPGVEACERREVLALPGLGGIGLELFKAAVSGGVGQGLNYIINRPDDLKQKLDEITAQLDRVEARLDAIEQQIRGVQESLDRTNLATALDKLKLPLIDRYWDDYERAIADGTPDRAAFDVLTRDVTTDLRTTPVEFATIFNPGNYGVRSHDPLMTAFSKVLISQVDTAPYLTDSYTDTMVDGFDYYLIEQAKAVTLLEVSYRYQAADPDRTDRERQEALVRARQVAGSFPTPEPDPVLGRPEQREQWARVIATMPDKPIVAGLVIDPAHLQAWDTFPLDPGGGVYPHEAAGGMLYVVRGGYDQFINRFDTQPALKELLTRAFQQQLYINGGVGFLDWRVPGRDEVTRLSRSGLSRLVALGFDPNMMTHPVYTTEIGRAKAYERRGKEPQIRFSQTTFSVHVAITPATGAATNIFPGNAYYRDGNIVFPTYKPYSGKGANALYVANVRRHEFFV